MSPGGVFPVVVKPLGDNPGLIEAWMIWPETGETERFLTQEGKDVKNMPLGRALRWGKQKGAKAWGGWVPLGQNLGWNPPGVGTLMVQTPGFSSPLGTERQTRQGLVLKVFFAHARAWRAPKSQNGKKGVNMVKSSCFTLRTPSVRFSFHEL
jgi:hypothetical protein